jgi:hypothetical protein
MEKIVQKKHIFDHFENKQSFYVIDYCPSPKVIDDVTYQNIEVWKNLPRGRAEVLDSVTNEVIFTLTGLKKFGDNSETFGTNNSKEENWDTCIATIKENGEAFHVGCFKYNDYEYLVIGSKLVHIILCLSEDINRQLEIITKQQKTRVDFAVKMAKLFISKYLVTKDVNSKVKEYLISTKYTLVGEHINPENEHIVKYDSKCIRFFSIVSPDFLNTSEYCISTPTQMKEIILSLGLDFVELCKPVTNKDELDVVKEKYYNFENCEGLVLYYCKSGKVVYIEKFKNKQYTILRTIREYKNGNKSRYQLLQRFKNYHIPLSSKEQKHYLSFYYYLNNVNNVKKNDSFEEHFSTALYNDFLKYQIDNPSLSKDEKNIINKVYIVLVGIPGSGKTTIGSQLVINALQKGIKAVYIDQDMMFGNAKQFEEKCKTYLNSDYQLIINGKCNTTNFSRENSLKYINDDTELFVVKVHEDDLNKNDIKECIQRITNRNYHTSLFAKKAEEVVTNFYSSFENKIDNVYKQLQFKLNESIESKVYSIFEKVYTTLSIQNNGTQLLVQLQPSFIMCNYLGIKLDIKMMQNVLKNQCMSEFFNNTPWFIKATTLYHVTLLHSTNFYNYPNELLYYSELANNNTKLVVKIESLCWNSEIAAFKVSIPELKMLIKDHIYHITVYKKDIKVMNVESNNMLKSEHKSIPIELEIEGMVTRL